MISWIWQSVIKSSLRHYWPGCRCNRTMHGPLTRYVKLRVAHAPGMPGTFSPHPTSKKPLVSDPGMHHGTCVTHVPGCMSGSLTRGDGEDVPSRHSRRMRKPAILRIWQETHDKSCIDLHNAQMFEKWGNTRQCQWISLDANKCNW